LNLFGPVTGTGDLVTITNGGGTTVKLCSTNNNWIGRLVITNGATVWVGDDTTAAGNLPTTVTVTNLVGGKLQWDPPTNTVETWASDVAGPGTITKLGLGTLVVNNANSWTGPFTAGTTTVNGGIIRLLNNNGFGDGIVAKTAGILRSELRLEGGIAIPAGINFQVGGNFIDHGLMPFRNIAGTNSVAGSVELLTAMGAAEIASDAGLLRLNGPMFTTATGRIFRFSGAGNGVVNGVITNGANALGVQMNGPGTWTFTATNSYTGTTLVSGGKLLVNGAIGTNTVTVATNGTLGGTGTIGGVATFNAGAHAVLTLGSNLTFSSSLIISNGADVHLNLSNNVPIGNYTLATYNVTGSSGVFTSTPVIDSGSLAGANTGTIVTSGGIVQLQVAAAAPATPPNFPAGGVSVLPGGGISLVATGAIGGTYRLWATTNLALTPVTTTWTLLNSGTITTSPFTNIDLTATNYSKRFYLFSNP
jgi:autotransporter-associated beta strand protein